MIVDFTICQMLATFAEEFLDRNPISLLGILVTKEKRSEVVLELTGSARRHAECIERLREAVCSGEASIQNALQLAVDRLSAVPSHR